MSDPAPDDLLVRREGPLFWITFNRPRVRNALTWDMYERLVEACEQADQDPQVRVLVLSGAGTSFVAGTDISQFRAFQTEQDALDYEEGGDRMMRALEQVGKPTLAAIGGPCTGAGAVIAACCDIRLASPAARYGVPIARTLGNCLSLPNLDRLTALLGPARVADLIMRARLMDAKEMLAVGLVSEVTASPEELLPRARQIAQEIAANAPLTLMSTKQALRRLRQIPPSDQDSDLVLRCYMSADFREGVEAFLAKRTPRWRGE